MSDEKPNKLKEALNNGVGTALSRLIIITMVPATLGLGAFIGNRVVGQIDELTRTVANQHEQTVTRVNSLDMRITGAEHDIAYLKDRK